MTEPIAIVGRGCVLPGALDPDRFWTNIAAGRVDLDTVRPEDWRLPPGSPGAGATAGIVRDFVFDPTGFTGEVASYDPALQWVLHAGRAALREAGDHARPERTGLVLGNLGYPSRSLAAYAERVWLTGDPGGADPRDRFCSGLWAHEAANALGLRGGSLALDAACASALYAIKIAGDRLHDGTADLMLAGAVSGCDGLIIHAGFEALGALSPSGRSRPFHRDADGLIPAEGAALLAFMRLRDAVAAHVPVLGVVRGIGLSNDGRTGGFLVPAQEGQIRAMRAAYRQAGFGPETVELLECHATGTPVGDVVEARSTARFFGDRPAPLPIGSAKGNVGHLLTASGAAGLLKLLGAIRHGTFPATPGAADPIDELGDGPLRLLHTNEPWPGSRRRAAISAFGFGGNNAHLIVEAFDGRPAFRVAVPARTAEIAVVAIGTRAGDGDAPPNTVEVALDDLRYPPRDLGETLGQQLLVLEAARDAARGITLPPDSTSVLIGLGCDPEVARAHARLRLGAGDEFSPPLTAARVLGAMANIAANRISGQLGLAGPGFAVSAEEASGIVALDLASRALRAGEIDAALVGAVDLADEPVHRAAVTQLGRTTEPADAAVVLVLKRADDARRDGEPILALIDREKPADGPPVSLFGAAHAAVGLLEVAAAVVRGGTADVVVPVLGAPPARVRLRAAGTAPPLHVYSGTNRSEVLAAAAAGIESDSGPARLAVLTGQLAGARAWLAGDGLRPSGVAFREAPIGGETAFVYTQGSAFYPGMGADLALAFAPLADDRLHHGGTAPDPLDRILAVGSLSGLHTRIAREVLGIEPQAAIGFSSGESAALAALGAWTDVPAMIADARADGLFTHDLSGDLRAVRRFWERNGTAGERWVGYLLAAEAELVRAMVAAEPAVHLSAVCAPGVCVVAGEEEACTAFAERFDPAARIRLDYLVAHVPEVADLRDRWHALHRRPTTSVPGIRFYRGATGDWYHPAEQSAADAITAQMMAPVDFPAVIERAWQDGVRVFIEQGPAAQCTGWIHRILGRREHVAVAMDAQPGQGMWSLSTVVAELAAAGVPVRHDALRARSASAGPTISLPKRLPGPYTIMAPAPDLRPMPVERPPDPAVSAALAWRASITAAHLQYLEIQATAHARFLSGRAAAISALTRPAAFPGPRFDRAQLEHLASGRISDLFGPAFAAQDNDVRQTRMPGPPLLLADRVLGIDAEPGRLGHGTIWTETDVQHDSWYLDAAGRMPPGLVVEAGQADLLLISWLGADLHNRGERVYRLLGSDVTFHGPPPGPGRTLRFEIRVVDHVSHGSIRLFFFEYDCHVDDQLLLTVRNGQAGFFTDDELLDTGGVIWEPPPITPSEPTPSEPTAFDADAVDAFARGRPDLCFGPGWAATRAHVRTPRIGSGPMRLLDEVPVFDPGSGYLRAETAVRPDDWFFDGHFHNDPCMPGTLMSEACLQAVSFYLAAAGHTVDRDGWRFEPEPGRTARMRCRGQVTPKSQKLTYEVFLSSMTSDPFPTVVADVLVTVDGVKALHVADCAVRLVPDWPLEHWRHLGPPTVQRTARPEPLPALGGLAGHEETRPVARIGDLPLGYASLLACAWGRPTDGLGPMAEAFLGARRGPRLPGPPYHFMSRVTAVEGPYQGMAVGSAVVAEYDVPGQAWYFATGTMPVAALMEIALQPCGWLGGYVGSPLQIDAELLFRNLDGDLRVFREVRPGTRVVRTRAELTGVSRAAGMIIETFRIECHADGEPLLSGTSVFGYFRTTAFAQQPGLPAVLTEPNDYRAAFPQAAGPMLTMLDRITGYWPEGGAAGLGRLRAEKDVDPGDWFFKAHFFQDPVMPGSLGVEAMCQLLQWYLLDRGLDAGPGFEPVALDEPLTWTYRGQVGPGDRRITVELEILEVRDRTAYAKGWLWIDGRRIYRVDRLAARLRPTR